MRVGDKVIYTGRDEHGNEFRVCKIYRYKELFGTKIHTVIDTRKDCCNTYLVLQDIPGMYNSRYFRLHDTPGTPIG